MKIEGNYKMDSESLKQEIRVLTCQSGGNYKNKNKNKNLSQLTALEWAIKANRFLEISLIVERVLHDY